MQKTFKTRGTRLLALVLMLVMLVGLLSVSVLAAADAKPTKITLVGSDEALAKMKLWLQPFRCEGVKTNLSDLFDLKSL